jgi:3-dehydroquinate dehydratase/shikimate dehydrogenase
MTQLCVAIFVTDEAQAKRDIALAAEAGADLVELRLDTFTGDAWALLEKVPLPVICTCRTAAEGGQSTASNVKRMALLGEVAPRSAYVDVELETARASPPSRTTLPRLILSSHDFNGRPERLTNLVMELIHADCDVAKIVWTARTIRDNLEAFEILQSRQKPTIAICMGEAGLISRVLARKFGGFLTFASLDGSAGTAPGQISVLDMKRLYRWDAIAADTKVYGVVGHPLGHSLSPAVHNAAFDQFSYNGVYLPLLVNPGYESFKAFMESFLALKEMQLSGLSITIPHKENAMRYLKEKGAEVEPLAEQIGAVNTIVIADGKLRGLNTDYAAILDSITSKLEITREQLKNYRVAVIGAGGTGRTAVAALSACGATVVVYNRTRDKADALAREFTGRTGKVVSVGIDKLCDSCCQIYINTTSIGMSPNGDQSPMVSVSADVLVFDVVYNPMRTRLLAQAEAAGSKTISGVEMFIRQAGAQFQAWTGEQPPLALMREIVEQKLS